VDNTSHPDGPFPPGETHPPEPVAAGPPGTQAFGSQAREGKPTVTPDYGRRPGLLIHALAGLEAGMVGVIWMFGCFLVAAFWNGQGIWSVPNLFATVFYGDNAYQAEFLHTTWAGMALIVVLYGVPGVLWGCLWKDKRAAWLGLYGALTGLAVYYFSFHYVWPQADPLIPVYAPVRQLQIAHILWGAALARSPGYSKRIALATAPPVVPHGDGNQGGQGGDRGGDQDAAEIVSGELIR